MPSSVQELCRHLACAFSEGRLDGLSDHYAYPLVIYLPEGIRIEMTPEDTAEAIFARRMVALKAGMRSVRVRIAKVAEMEGRRIPVRLSWDFLGEDGRLIGRSSMRYFCRRSADGALRVEMIEFTRIAFSETLPKSAGSARRN